MNHQLTVMVIDLIAILITIYLSRHFSRKSTAYSIILAHNAPESFRMESSLRQQGRVKGSYELRARNIRRLIVNTHRFFKDHGINYWVESGVLLGLHNHNDVLPYDADEDVGITREGKNILDRLFFSRPRVDNKVVLPEYKLRLKKNHDSALIYVLEDMDTDVYCDIFFYQLNNGYLIQNKYDWFCKGCQESKFKMPASYVFPTKNITSGNLETPFEISIPNHPQKCLEYMYGKKLDPNYKWSDKHQEYIRI